MIYRWPSPGKLNLFLYIIGRRADNYHTLQTLFQFVDYGDSIEILTTNTGEIRLFSTTKKMQYSNNLIIKAAKLLKYYCHSNNKTLGADIFLHKILPIGSGLGGASSNAATVLMVLNYQWRCYLSNSVLMRLGLMLGADVPVFIYGISSFAEGIGEMLTPVRIPEKWYIIIIPPINIHTAFIFKMYTFLYSHYSLNRSIEELLRIPFHNDFELIVKQVFPTIKIYFAYLSQYTLTRLTGTGSCIFSEFKNEYLAFQAQSSLPSWMNSIVTKGMNISPLHCKLLKNNML